MSQPTIRQNTGIFSDGAYTASFEWKIKDYLDISRQVDSRLDSPNIECLDATWCLRLYPNGESSQQSAGWMGLYLARKKSTTPKHFVKSTLKLKRHDGFDLVRVNYTFKFNEDTSLGWPRFFQASVQNKEGNATPIGGTLTLFCRLSVNTCESVEAAVQTDTFPAVEKLVQDFRNLMVNEEASDVILNVKNRKFRVHSAVLVARSSIFAAMMKHDMKEKSSGIVEITDCDPDAFQVFLKYLYAGDMEQISADNVFELHAIADKYDTEEIKTTCIQLMKDSLSVEIFCDVLALALRHNESELLDTAVKFLGRNMKAILATTKWQTFVIENPIQANKLNLKALDYYSKSC